MVIDSAIAAALCRGRDAILAADSRQPSSLKALLFACDAELLSGRSAVHDSFD
jgi:hypothetical protein